MTSGRDEHASDGDCGGADPDAAARAELAKYCGMKRRDEIVYSIGGHTMTGLAINSFGIQTEPGYPAVPE